MATVPVDLWRGVNTDDMPVLETKDGPVDGVLHPTFSRKKIGQDKHGKDKFRKPDVTIKDGLVQPGGGTSLFDKDRFFAGDKWNFFMLPKGTVVPDSLFLKGPDWNDYFQANHYQIEAKLPMTPDALRGALDNFARAAFAKRYVDARTGKN